MQSTQSKNYDYIIAGMGCAGLSLAVQLKQSKISFSKVLIIDREIKNKNDRTWCFWTKEKKNWFDKIIYKKWNHLQFKSNHEDFNLEINPYQYCLIRGIDFYDFCLNQLKKDARFEFVSDEINSISSSETNATLATKTKQFSAKYIFNSAFRNQNFKKNHINYVQHFKGLVVEFQNKVVDVSRPVFMDFSVEQKNDCRFVYEIPFSKNKVLIEYTGFSKNVVTSSEYDHELKEYIKRKYRGEFYKILETESGQIPMHESKFINPFGARVINIGTAGGASKASSGYTFYFIQKQVNEIIEQLKNNSTQIVLAEKPKRYQYFDRVLLHVLNEKKIEGSKVFEILFKKNKVVDVFEFLNEESSLAQDLKIINTLPKKYFVWLGIKKLVG